MPRMAQECTFSKGVHLEGNPPSPCGESFHDKLS
ncbi:hypothetical protein NIES4071_64430 [Calothrix sp. NIES-4071]|nr:hypothetical protein NIES4071_64430 [Calothrix sp. NIES-4071]BAZ60747.1 hypothetical protein NIES4105_64390 [Calothrix sp. NIES-4105]